MKTSHPILWAFLCGLGLALAPAAVRAFGIETTDNKVTGTVVRWGTLPISYYLDEGGTNGLTASEAQKCFRESFQEWQEVECSRLAFREMGTTANKRVLPMRLPANGRSELVWINDSSWSFDRTVLGVTSTNGLLNWGTITEADIAFNGYNYRWNLSGKVGTLPYSNDMDCKSVAIHEIGHLFGLQHVLIGGSVVDPPTMAPAVDPLGRSADLSLDDQLGACFLYPSGQYYTCTKDAECPMVVGYDFETKQEYVAGQIYCQNGYCQGGGGVAPYTVEMGGTCTTNSDCIRGLTCRNYFGETKICTTTCDPLADDCPDLFHCEVPQGETASLCMPGKKKIPVGEPCSNSYECATAFCFPAPDRSGMTCRVPCTRDSDQCGPNEACWSASSTSTGGCYPKDQVPVTKKKLDVECASHQECESGLCYSEEGETPRCRLSCNPQAPFCYANYWCKDLGWGGACIPTNGKKADGETCEDHLECRSGWCVWTPTLAASYCRTSCDLQTWLCPQGTACVSYGSTEWGVCMPSAVSTGEGCASHRDCTTALCISFGEAYGSLCSQNCIAGWCPNDWTCHLVEGFGEVCGPADAAPPEVPPADEPGTDEGSGSTDDREGEEEQDDPTDEGAVSPTDQDTPPIPQPRQAGGCGVAPGATAPFSAILGPMILVLGLRSLRRRDP